MVKHGARPTRIKHNDYDFLKSHKFGGIAPSFPAELLTDAGIYMPNQEVEATYLIEGKYLTIPAEPYGCTNFTTAGLADDLTGKFHNPLDLEAVTHANAKGGIDIRTALDAARKLGWIEAYFNIRPAGSIDAFDAIRLATLIAELEKRSVSWGTPWFPSWERAAQQRIGVMPMPTDAELALIRKDTNIFPWHNSKHAVWKTINGIPVLRNKSWQGQDVGDGGWLYFTRDVVNVVMTISGTVAYTATNKKPTDVQTIDVNFIQYIVSLIKNLLHIP